MSSLTPFQQKINPSTVTDRLKRSICSLRLYVSAPKGPKYFDEYEVEMFPSESESGGFFGKCPLCDNGHLIIPRNAAKVNCTDCDFIGFLPEKKRA